MGDVSGRGRLQDRKVNCTEYGMNLADLHVTQHDLRNLDQIPQMVEFVQKGGFFTLEEITRHHDGDTSLISLTRFEDGRVFVHNGHHRVAAVWLAGRERLNSFEYLILDKKYSDYLEPNYLRPDGHWLGWVTPFDPRKEVRAAEFGDFKQRVREIFEQQGEPHATHYVLTNGGLYKAEKRFDTVPQLADYVAGEICVTRLGGSQCETAK